MTHDLVRETWPQVWGLLLADNARDAQHVLGWDLHGMSRERWQMERQQDVLLRELSGCRTILFLFDPVEGVCIPQPAAPVEEGETERVIHLVKQVLRVGKWAQAASRDYVETLYRAGTVQLYPTVREEVEVEREAHGE